MCTRKFALSLAASLAKFFHGPKWARKGGNHYVEATGKREAYWKFKSSLDIAQVVKGTVLGVMFRVPCSVYQRRVHVRMCKAEWRAFPPARPARGTKKRAEAGVFYFPIYPLGQCFFRRARAALRKWSKKFLHLELVTYRIICLAASPLHRFASSSPLPRASPADHFYPSEFAKIAI